jgi:hypothetical protein
MCLIKIYKVWLWLNPECWVILNRGSRSDRSHDWPDPSCIQFHRARESSTSTSNWHAAAGIEASKQPHRPRSAESEEDSILSI